MSDLIAAGSTPTADGLDPTAPADMSAAAEAAVSAAAAQASKNAPAAGLS
jgi:hypothetical protein